jgi:hypothetical protein
VALLIPNGDIATLPASVTPIPPDILTAEWQFVMTPNVDSASLPNDFGFVTLFGRNDDQMVTLQSVGGGLYRLDLYVDGGSRQIGVLDWTGSPVIRVRIDVPNATVSAEVLSGAVNFGGGWDSVVGNLATRTVSAWAWSTGSTLNVGGFAGLFLFDGTIQDVADENGVVVDEELIAPASGTSTAAAVVAAIASVTATAAGTSAASASMDARAELTASASGAATATAELDARAPVAATAAGTAAAAVQLDARAEVSAPAAGTSTTSTLALRLTTALVALASGIATTSAIALRMTARIAARAAGSSEARARITGGAPPRTIEEIIHFGWDGTPAKKMPEFGDPELLPKSIEYRGSAERPWFDLTGRAITPTLPGDFMNAPDVQGKPWVRLRGDEWTDAAMRAEVLRWIGERFSIDRLLTRWEVVETGAVSGSATRSPVLMIRLWRGKAVREASSGIPESMRNAASMRTVCDAFLPVLSFDS